MNFVNERRRPNNGRTITSVVGFTVGQVRKTGPKAGSWQYEANTH